MNLHNPARIEALLCCHFLALLIRALLVLLDGGAVALGIDCSRSPGGFDRGLRRVMVVDSGCMGGPRRPRNKSTRNRRL